MSRGVGVEGHDGNTAVLHEDGSLYGGDGGLGAVTELRGQLFYVRLVEVIVGVFKIVVVVDDRVNRSLAGPGGATVDPGVPSVFRGVAGVPFGIYAQRWLLKR